MILAPFFISPAAPLPLKFGNVGYSYENSSEVDLHGLTDPYGSKMLGPNEFIAFWNECSQEACTTGTAIKIKKTLTGYAFDIQFKGAPLAQSSEWTGPGWTQAWIEPYINVKCGKIGKKTLLMESIGINPKHGKSVSGMRQTYNSFLVPITRTVSLDCPGGLKSIEVGRSATLLYGLDVIRELHPQPVKIDMELAPKNQE